MYGSCENLDYPMPQLEAPLDLEKSASSDRSPLGFIELRPNGYIGETGFILKGQKADAAGSCGTLSADDETSNPDGAPMPFLPQSRCRDHALFLQLGAQPGDGVLIGGEA